MSEPSNRDAARPLPPEWLPDPHPPEGSTEWEEEIERIMAAAGQELRRLGNQRAAHRPPTMDTMGGWWRPAAMLAVAALTLLLLAGNRGGVPAPPQESLALGLVAAEGDPVALWGIFGLEADPVLALIALERRNDGIGLGSPRTSKEGRNR